MADIVLTIPDDQFRRAVDALCAVGGYSGDANDQGKRAEYARDVLVRYVREAVMTTERQRAVARAMADVTAAPITID